MKALRIFTTLSLFAALAVTAAAQVSSVDLTFSAVPSVKITGDNALGKGIVIQPDGKQLIWGGNFAVDGFAKGRLARLNADGTVDTSFAYCDCLATVSNAAVQTDGKILVGGSYAGQAKIVRLNSDGTLDPSFNSVFTVSPALASFGEVIRIQPDGKVLADFSGAYAMGFHARSIVRLNTDGSADPGFSNINYDGGRLISTALTALALDPSGKFYTGMVTYSGGTSSATLRRYNANGTQDSTWEVPSLAPNLGTSIGGLGLQADGSLIVSGRFDTVNGVSKQNVVRLFPAGNVDMTFTAPILGSSGGQIAILQNGKILIAKNTTGNLTLVRLNTDGSLDDTFTMSSLLQSFNTRFALDASERIYVFGLSDALEYRYFRLNPNGDRDPGYNPNVTLFGQIHALARLADGKVVMAGLFTQVNGFARSSLARVNPDGTLDPSLEPGDGFDIPPAELVPQSDGKIIAVGPFTQFKLTPRQGIARILVDGNLDLAFAPTITGGVSTASLQADGKILIGGSFNAVNGVTRTNVARLNSDGTLDNTFNPVFGGSGPITNIFQQPDGKIMVAGSFSGVNGFNRSGAVRLTSTGDLDQTFNATGTPGVGKIYLLADGRYFAHNSITLTRRNSDGSVDNTFTPATVDSSDSNGRSINSLVLQPDGGAILLGRFDKVGTVTRRNITRLTSTGSLDTLFLPLGTDLQIRASVSQPDGKVIIGGDFARVENVSRAGVARLSIAAIRRPAMFDFDGDGRTDISVFRSSTNRWYEARSSDGSVYEETFGTPGDILAPADFDGDGTTDEAIYRPSNGQWWFHSSVNGGLVLNVFGSAEDIPRPSDFDGDGKADLIFYRPSNRTWYRIGSMSPTQLTTFSFGAVGDQPLVGDFDGDGRSDPAVFRPSTGDWWYAASSANNAFRQAHWGANGDIPVPADYDGDGKTDFAIFRPSDGGWYIYNSGNGSFTILAFGTNGDRPVAGDYDGDGRADIAVFRPSTGIWYLYRTTAGFAGYQFGISTDVAIPGALIP